MCKCPAILFTKGIRADVAEGIGPIPLRLWTFWREEKLKSITR